MRRVFHGILFMAELQPDGQMAFVKEKGLCNVEAHYH